MKSQIAMAYLSMIFLITPPNVSSEIVKNAVQMIKNWGYYVEEHPVHTEDGFILGVLRIPAGRNRVPGAANKKAVLLQHGFTSSCVDWIANRPDQSLAFMLADHGYDVWLGNTRGNVYSQNHERLNKTQKEFWNWSWDEMSREDLPAMVDYILRATNQSQLDYVGHSEGTMIAFARLSYDLNITAKIRHFYALAPVVTAGHIKSPVRLLAPFAWEIKASLSLLGDFSLGKIDWVLDVVRPLCKNDTRWIDFCENLLMFFDGPEQKTFLNKTMVPQYLSQHPDDTSMKNVAHFAQMVQSGKFERYNYGIFGNLKKYGKIHAPQYNISSIQTPITLFFSDSDEMADPQDVTNVLLNLPKYTAFRVPDFSHLDFVFAIVAKERIYDHILEEMSRL